MLVEMDNNHYCSINRFEGGKTFKWCDLTNGPCQFFASGYCEHCHRKWPTSEQFFEEYGEEWEGAVYRHCTDEECDSNNCVGKGWTTEEYGCLLTDDVFIVCACTPWGKPPNDWRPK